MISDKKSFLLDSIIKAYIEHSEPIGSKQLKSMYNLTYSSATIRGYFKKLGEEGYLIQEHSSSGRRPTIETLKNYWGKNLKFDLPKINFDKLNNLAYKMGLTVFIKQQTTDTLHRVLNVENIYMILEFYKTKSLNQNSNFSLTTTDECYAVTIKFNSAFYKFLTDMRGLTFDEILDISKQVGANHLHSELSKYVQNNIFEIVNSKNFLEMAIKYDFDEKDINMFIQGDIMLKLEQGVYLDSLLPNDYIAICHDTKVAENDIKILVIGKLSKDYEYFYKGIIDE
jgi:heat-inducible transcriptional repressor